MAGAPEHLLMSDPDPNPASLYEKVLAAAGEAARPAPKPPRPSAAIVLWRSAAGGLQVYWVQRAPELAFMGGWHAFPGGALSRTDLALPVTGEPRGFEGPDAGGGFPDSLLDGAGDLQPDLVPGLAACALRELFEETGVLLATELLPGSTSGPAATAGALGDARRRLLEDEAPFHELIDELGLTPCAEPLVFAGRWLTPPFAPRRFDNRFFLVEWPAAAALQPAVVPGELVAGEWIAPAAGVDRWRRGEVIAAPPVLHLLRVLAEDGPQDGLGRLRRPVEADLGPYRRIEFRPGVLMFPLATRTLPPADRTNAYLLGTRERVLIDPGSTVESEIDRLHRALAALAAEGGRVSAIWLTHHHPDHAGGVEALRRLLGVPVLAHAAAARTLAARGIAVDGELTDGQRVVLDGPQPFPVRVVHTPGHARGHLCFHEEAGGSLIAGDMVAGIGTIVIDPPEGDMDDYLASLERLLLLAPSTLFPAHGPPILDAAGKLREYLDHRRWREERVLEAWNAGLREPEAMLPTVYDDAPREAWPLAARQIEAHLRRLRRAGRIE
jgi:glyoxylase-like metal-dependent hydrolase (beta-lactamase superfamily II)/8-oxo-dGTP pyrophosphatase MutT (NUDIX family)